MLDHVLRVLRVVCPCVDVAHLYSAQIDCNSAAVRGGYHDDVRLCAGEHARSGTQVAELTAAGCGKVFTEKASGVKTDRVELYEYRFHRLSWLRQDRLPTSNSISRPARVICAIYGFAKGSSSLTMTTPIRRAEGLNSRINSTLFPATSAPPPDSPFILPPGRARLATIPVATGSPAAITIGMSLVSCLAANARAG
jgi:hypothetical protein